MRKTVGIRVRSSAFLAGAILLAIGRPSWGEITDIHIQTDTPGFIACGRSVGIIAINDGHDPVLTYQWEARGIGSGCPSVYTGFGGNANSSFVIDNRAGEVVIKPTVTCVQPMQMPGMPPPAPGHPPTVIERMFEYVAADGVDWATLNWN